MSLATDVVWDKLRHFGKHEFGRWAPYMSGELLFMLDETREQYGDQIWISPAPGALGRFIGNSKSMHNIERWGEIRAVDVMPLGMDTPEEYEAFFELAKSVGWTGIGIYPDWQPRPGAHLDNRPDRKVGSPAKWSAFRDKNGKQQYYAIDKAFKL